MSDYAFQPFPKIPRLVRGCTITEKIDGTNAQIYIVRTTPLTGPPTEIPLARKILEDDSTLSMYAGSRSRYIQPGKSTDNYGFAQWVVDHVEEFWKLGEGRHYGEWWGGKIGRGYGIVEKRFSLFNTRRWQPGRAPLPEGITCVPVLYEGEFTAEAIDGAMRILREQGSQAQPGFNRPEGIVVFHHASSTMFKRTLENDSEPKGLASPTAEADDSKSS